VLQDGECVPDSEAICSERTVFDEDEGACVPTDTVCADGTELDSMTGQCVPTSEIECSPSTTEENGECVPNAMACSGATEFDSASGKCVVAAEACGSNTELDPNTGECVETDAVCTEGTSFDSTSGTCMPNADVCEAGTTFNDMTGTCTPDATCQMGDVIFMGMCFSPAEEAFETAEVAEMEPNDPNYEGGAAQQIDLTAKGVDEPLTLSGAIGAPTDIDMDGNLDQDYDVFEFEATAGQWIEIGVQSVGLPQPAFRIDGPEGYTRFSTEGLQGDMAGRKIVIPWDGTYTLTVAPTVAWTADGGPFGADDWNYAASLTKVATPMPVSVDLTAMNASGDLPDLDDNYFEIDSFTADSFADLQLESLGGDAEADIMIWDGGTLVQYNEDVEQGDEGRVVVPSSGSFQVLVDWVRAEGPDLGFEFSGSQGVTPVNFGAIGDDMEMTDTTASFLDDDTKYILLEVNAGQVIEVAQANEEDDDINIALFSEAGEEIDDNSSFETDDFLYHYSPEGGRFYVEFENDSGGDLTNFVVTINSITPEDLGAIMAGGSKTGTAMGATAANKSHFYQFSLMAGEFLELSQTNDETDNLDVTVYNADNGDFIESDGSLNLEEFIYHYAVDGGNFLVEVNNDKSSVVNNIMTTFNSVTPQDLGTLAAGGSQPVMGGTLTDNQRLIVKFTISPGEVLEFLFDNDEGEDANFDLLSEDGETEFEEDSSFEPLSNPSSTGPDYFYRIHPMGGMAQTYIAILENDSGAALNNVMPTVNSLSPTDQGTFTVGDTVTATQSNTVDDDRREYHVLNAMDLTFFEGTLVDLDMNGNNVDVVIYDYATGDEIVELDGSGDEDIRWVFNAGQSYLLEVIADDELPAGYELDGSFNEPPISYMSAPGLLIPDNTSPGAVDTITVAGESCTIDSIEVEVDIEHSFRGDLVVDIVAPGGGTTVRLHDGGGGSRDDIIGTYPTTLSLPMGSDLADFQNLDVNGDWTLRVEDDALFIDGTLNSWGLNFFCQ
jgi:subtilisin-like proprotein convertase family protein